MEKGASGKLAVKRAVSAGGIVYRLADDNLEVLLCGHREPPIWGLPKGTPEPGEKLEAAALREVSEETGVKVAIEAKVGVVDYWFVSKAEGVRYHKNVHFYLMVPVGGDPALHDYEYDFVEWFPVEEALRTLSYANEVETVRKAVAMVGSRLKGEDAEGE